MNSLYMVQPDELGQELVFGKPKSEVSTPGPAFHLLADRDGGDRPDARRAGIPRLATPAAATAPTQPHAFGRPEHRRVNFSVLWRVSDPKKYLFNVSDPDGFLRRVAESAMRELVGRSSAEEVRTETARRGRGGREQLAADDARQLRLRRHRRWRAARARRPADGSRRRLRGGAARAAGSRPLPARGRSIRQPAAWRCARPGGADDETAQGYKQQVVAEAQGESKRFLSVLDAIPAAPRT